MSDPVRDALAELLRFVPNIEVLGEWSVLGINRASKKRVRAQLDAIVGRARSALAAATAQPGS